MHQRRPHVGRFRGEFLMLARLSRLPLLPGLAVALWVSLVVVVAVKSVVAPLEHTLFPMYAEASRDLWRGEPRGNSCFAWQHLPYFADLFAPFAQLPEWAGGTLWSLLSLAVFISGLVRFFAMAGRGELSANAWALLLL